MGPGPENNRAGYPGPMKLEVLTSCVVSEHAAKYSCMGIQCQRILVKFQLKTYDTRKKISGK